MVIILKWLLANVYIIASLEANKILLLRAYFEVLAQWNRKCTLRKWSIAWN